MRLTHLEQRQAAKEFADKWKGKGYEKGESAKFWLSLLHEVYGVKNPAEYIKFEERVKLDNTSFIDGYIAETKVLIEQKSIGKNLFKKIRQSDGTELTPFQQAKRYSIELPYSERPRWIIISNFETFHIYDMEDPGGEPEVLELKNLEKEYYRLSFLVNKKEENIIKMRELSFQAGEIIGELYDALLKEYQDPTDSKTLKDLNTLSVRLVFCFYAEDAGLLGRHRMFYNYLSQHRTRNEYFRDALIKLFKVFNQRKEERSPYLEEELAEFPYVNGGLFEEDDIEIPRMNQEIIEIILDQASSGFNWKNISPTIFGSLFESTLNPETRKTGGMHYTSIENIHRVIDPLFMDSLNKEFEEIKTYKTYNVRIRKLEEFQEKLASITFLDPAAGSGNFLTETYISLRRLENEVIKEINGMQVSLNLESIIKVSIDQFYGIEINDFAVTVAKTALWIAEAQMMQETEDIVHSEISFLPIKSDAKLVHGNALLLNWDSVTEGKKVNYIIGNPPFLGYSNQTKQQKEDLKSVYIDEKGKQYKNVGKLDYVAGWFFKAAEYVYRTKTQVAFVSTSSIVQGEQVSNAWKPLYERYNIEINFGYRPFKWRSEAHNQAMVFVVIIGFSYKGVKKEKRIFNENQKKRVTTISPYLVEGPVVFIENRSKPLEPVLEMTTGNRPAEGGNLIIEENEYTEFITKEPQAEKYIKRLMGSNEFIHNKKRYCLWLLEASPREIRQMPEVLKRVQASKEDRLKGAPDRQKLAATPALFRETKNPDKFLIIPKVSTSKRKYIPMGYLRGDTIPTDLAFIIPDADLYYLGILMSNVHMSWVRAVAGRMGDGYRYSTRIVYNNFPWPKMNDQDKELIRKKTRKILEVREKYKDSSLADLYDEVTMPKDLREAHERNDKAVMKLYGLDIKSTEEECVALLIKLYKEKAEE